MSGMSGIEHLLRHHAVWKTAREPGGLGTAHDRRTASGGAIVSPFQGCIAIAPPKPRALPWAVMYCLFEAIGMAGDSRRCVGRKRYPLLRGSTSVVSWPAL